jgi:HSP20 family protein
MRRKVTLGVEFAVLRRQLQELLTQAVALPASPRGFAPTLDLATTDAEFVLRVDLPGVDPRSLEVQLVGSEVQISGEKPAPPPGRRLYHQVERAYGPFQLEVVLPGKVSARGSRATFRNGVLEVLLPREPERPPEPVPIPVETGEP